jgi:pyridoxal phosphate enzyme (YggS family)
MTGEGFAHEESDDERTRALTTALALTQDRIEQAASAADRPVREVHLIVVTKTFPAADVVRLARLGATDVGENRDQEAAGKRVEVEGVLGSGTGPRWHLVGTLQSNKCRSVARWADLVHSLDRPRVVEALGRAAVDHGRTLEALVQVSLDDAPGRGGASLAAVPLLADQVAGTPGLALRGVMAVAPLDGDPWEAFARLEAVAARVRSDHPEAGWISAGMSGDLEAAIANGATHVRVGSAILGGRAPLR